MPQPAPVDEHGLEELLSRPTAGAVESLRRVEGDILLLGAGGKIGPTMARMARRARDEGGSSGGQIIAVSRFSDDSAAQNLEAAGVVVHRADLSEPGSYASLPDAAVVYYLAAVKFGTAGNEPNTWWTNAAIPALVADRYRGVPTVVYSTGNVYPLTSLAYGGSRETDQPQPNGEYAQSCLARERIFTHAAGSWGSPTALFRLNYACELRYGVISDLASQISAGQPIDVTMPAVNVLWQGDATSWALQSIDHVNVSPTALNATGPETVPVRRLATWLGQDMGTDVQFVGDEASDALLSDSSGCIERFGYPTLPLRTLVRWVAEWTKAGGTRWSKPTKFEQRGGQY